MKGTIGLDPDPSSVAEARNLVHAGLVECGREDLLDDAVLLTSELVTNATLHARSRIGLKLEVGAEGLRVAVSDESPAHPQKKHDRGELESGRGLLLVDSMADTWGVTQHGKGKAVWFRLA
jgi:anti-sigma regulatory factor (Ser/Thr protein kinase)